MEQAVTGIGSELGSAMGRLGRDLDTWGNKLETKVEELLPGWVPPASAFEQALDSRWDELVDEGATSSSPASQQTASGRSHSDWSWPDGDGSGGTPMRCPALSFSILSC